jgi:hypothetical protein
MHPCIHGAKRFFLRKPGLSISCREQATKQNNKKRPAPTMPQVAYWFVELGDSASVAQ